MLHTSQPLCKLQEFIMNKSLFRFFIIFFFLVSSFHAQQQYSGNSIKHCNISDKTGPSPAFLYTCNNHKIPSCQTFLIFRTKHPYLSLSSISELITSSDPIKLAHINNLSRSEILPEDKEVIVPINCSCSSTYYQAKASYVIRSDDETYFSIANETYQGLSTCNALMRENPYNATGLYPELKLRVPLRCACPTQEQLQNRTLFLLTYVVTWGDTVYQISKRFNVSVRSVNLANGFLEKDVIFPFTTILIPLEKEPLSSQMRSLGPKSSSHPFVPEKQHKNSVLKRTYIGILTGAALSVLCFVLFLGFVYYRRNRTDEGSSKNMYKLPEYLLDKVVGVSETLKVYTYQELQTGTDNFSPFKSLSDSVYRGVLHEKLVVIKKMRKDVTNEIKILGNINHFNLISLYGVCEHEGNFYLVYEYLEEGSLRDWLNREHGSDAWSWQHRIIIALDVANGLYYLHNFTSPAYVHKGINSCNILLNRDLRAKIGNFHLARGKNGNSYMSCVVGEKVYMAPEYVRVGKVTSKIDVYAFGVVLLELVTGRDAVVVCEGKEVLLSDLVISAMNGGNGVNDLIDPRLVVKNHLGYIVDRSEVALRLLKLGSECLAQEPEERLSMAQVVADLMKIQLDVHNSMSFSIE